MRNSLLTVAALCAFASSCFTSPLKAQPPEGTTAADSRQQLLNDRESDSTRTTFLRIRRDSSGNPISLQTTVTRFRSKDGRLLVDLIGAVHVGEKSYYDKLNRQFTQYDSLLYELVAPEGARVPNENARRSSGNPLTWIHDVMCDLLGLESQLSAIDYEPKNFVHADLSPAEMSAKMAERGETPLTVGLAAFAEMLRQQNLNRTQSSSDGSAAQEETVQSLFYVLDDPLKLKRLMAAQFTESGAVEMGLGQTLNRILVEDRNAACMRVLKSELNAGKTKLGIFYGAAHMNDFERRLTRDLKLRKTDHVWVDAWDLTRSNRRANAFSDSVGILTEMINRLIDSD
jgi:hypothetical protein